MLSGRRVSILVAGFTALSFATVTPMFATRAIAQTMGEYGGIVGHGGSGRSQMPNLEPRSGFGTRTDSGGGQSGPSHTEEIRPDDPRSADDSGGAVNDQDTTPPKPTDDWVQVQ